MFKTICFLLYTSIAFAQQPSLEFKLRLHKDSIEAMEPIPYSIELINHSDTATWIADNKQGKYGTKLEIREKGTETWQTLWLSEMEKNKLCIIGPRTPNPNPIYGFNHRPHIQIQRNTTHHKSTSYFPFWRHISQVPFKENTAYEIRLASEYHFAFGIIYSTPQELFIKQSKPANQQFLKEFTQQQLSFWALYPPWWQCGRDLYSKYKYDRLKKNHPDSDLADWITYQEQEMSFIRIKNKVNPEVLNYTLGEIKSHLYKMISKDYFPTLELKATLQNIINHEFTLHKNKEAHRFESTYLQSLFQV